MGMLRTAMLDLVAWPFWNAEERRLRAGWRILVQIVVMIVLLGGLSRGCSAVHEMRERNLEAVFSQAPLFMLGALVVCVSVWLACRFLDRRPLESLGLNIDRRWWIDAAFGTALGALLMAGILGAELAFGWARYGEPPELPGPVPRLAFVPVALFPFLAIGFYEELVSRGYHLKNLAEGFTSRFIPPRSAIVLAAFASSAVFGIAHADNPNATAMGTGNIVFAGMMLASGYLTTGRLAIPIGLHFSWNYCQNLFGMQVSGQTTFSYGSLFAREPIGDPLVTGGAFGPEAGLTGLVAILVGTGATLLWVRLTAGPLRITPSLAEPPPLVRASLPRALERPA